MRSKNFHTIIIGGGITGLSAGYFLKYKFGIDDFIILEGKERTGGNIYTTQEAGFTVENGPNGFLDNIPETLELAADLGLTPLKSNKASQKRFLICNGRPVKVPEGGLSFLTSPLLSFPGRLRVFCEPFAPPKPPGDESVFNFAARRIGTEAASVLVDTMVKGVFAGDSHSLSLKSAFPKMAQMEAQYGSLVKALLAKIIKRIISVNHTSTVPGGPASPGGVLTSFRGGLSTLIKTLSEKLKGTIITNAEVMDLKKRNKTIRITTSSEEYTADKILIAIPAPQAAAILCNSIPSASELLRQIPSAPVTVAALSFNKTDLPYSLDGFGFLVPEKEDSKLLGCLWTSSIFPERAPAGKVLLRSMLGGIRDPRLADLPEKETIRVTLKELRRFLGPVPEPENSWVFYYPQGISQYPPGHEERLKALTFVFKKAGGIFAAGNSHEGISVNSCIVQAKKTAEKLR